MGVPDKEAVLEQGRAYERALAAGREGGRDGHGGRREATAVDKTPGSDPSESRPTRRRSRSARSTRNTATQTAHALGAARDPGRRVEYESN